MNGGGEMGRRVRETDWSQTPLGDYQTWPQSLRLSLSLVLNVKGIAALYWGPDQWLLYNDAYGEALGDRHPRAFGRPMPEVLTDIAPVLGPQVAQVLATGKSLAIENLSMVMRRHGQDQETVWTYGFSPVQGETGEFAGVLLIVTEMTQQILAEQRSRASEARQHYRVELGDALRTLSDPGEIQAEACRLLCSNLNASRVHYAEMEDDGEHAVVPYDHAAGVPNRAGRYRLADFATLISACRSGITYARADIASDGDITVSEKAILAGLPVAAIVLVPLVKDNVLEAFLAIHHAAPHIWSAEEIELAEETAERTWAAIEKSRAEARLLALNDTLQQRIDAALRDQAVIEEALRQSQKMEAIGQLTGGVAHDFNNLLTVIKSSTELLKRPNLSDDRRGRYVLAISTAVDRAAKLTGQLLAFARRQALRPEVFAACDSVRSLSAMMETLTGSNIKIVTELPEDICFVNADASQFDTALVNMAVNARDAMDGQGRLTIRVKGVEAMPATRTSSERTGAFVAVSISDTGAGIPPESLEQIFEPFFTTKPVGQGTGLGLSQVYGFARQSGGEVRVNSDVGKGSVFTLYLPRATAVDQVQKADEPEALMDGYGTCVLVVEDNVEVGNFAVQTLADLGYKTVLANNAQEALVELAKNADRFDVVFSDVVMPGMSGIDLAHEIRRMYHDLPVLLASGYSHVLAQNGSYGFELLHKPYSIEQLSRLLRKVATWQRRQRILGQRSKLSH